MDRVIITNDDGYQSMGIELLSHLANSAQYSAQVVVPEENHSGRSHSISLGPLDVRRMPGQAGQRWFVVKGTPVDCVRLALSEYFDGQPLCVLSGINLGWNLGRHVMASATVAAAREAAAHKIPAIAFSASDSGSWDQVAAMVARHLDGWMAYAVAHPGQYLNINLPNHAGSHWRWTTLDTRPIHLKISRVQPNTALGDRVEFDWVDQDMHDLMKMSDRTALADGVISVTRLSPDYDDYVVRDLSSPVVAVPKPPTYHSVH